MLSIFKAKWFLLLSLLFSSCCLSALAADKNTKQTNKLSYQPDAIRTAPPAEDPELVRLRTKIQKLAAKNQLLQEEQKLKMSELEKKIQEQAAENRMNQEINTKEALVLLKKLKETEIETQKLQTKNSLKTQQIQKLSLELRMKQMQQEEEKDKMSFEQTKMNFEQQKLGKELKKIQNRLQTIAAKEKSKRQVTNDPVYLKKPFHKKTLYVSDRRVSLNGPIVSKVGAYIADRIDFFNNKSSTDPIFIVIDYSPGGSVMEGYRILKAMETSKAPIHVVVKSFAASMAAIITSLADESYIYPNAVILHHEMSTFTGGNMTQLKERLEIAKKWEKRLMKPLAKKLGYRSMESLRKDMYKYNSDGDWSNFGDEAKKIKWVKHLVEEIRETGVIKHPDDIKKAEEKKTYYGIKRDPQTGKTYCELPPLRAFDFYHMHNPDSYYKIM